MDLASIMNNDAAPPPSKKLKMDEEAQLSDQNPINQSNGNSSTPTREDPITMPEKQTHHIDIAEDSERDMSDVEMQDAEANEVESHNDNEVEADSENNTESHNDNMHDDNVHENHNDNEVENLNENNTETELDIQIEADQKDLPEEKSNGVTSEADSNGSMKNTVSTPTNESAKVGNGVQLMKTKSKEQEVKNELHLNGIEEDDEQNNRNNLEESVENKVSVETKEEITDFERVSKPGSETAADLTSSSVPASAPTSAPTSAAASPPEPALDSTFGSPVELKPSHSETKKEDAATVKEEESMEAKGSDSDSDSSDDEADFFGEHTGPKTISSSQIDRRRLAMVENRMARRKPRSGHRVLGPLQQQPEVVGEERNIPAYSRAFRYDSAATNVVCFPHMEYTLCEKPPYKAGIHPLDRGTEVYLVDDDAQTVTSPGPYSSAKANVAIRGGGSWYFEIEVVNPCVRIGIGRRESSCEGPVGYDAYSYGVQSQNGWKVHCARTSEFMEPFGKGDVIGFHVHLPVDSRPRNFERTRAPFLYQNQVWIESRDYTPTSQMEQFVQPRNYRPVLEKNETIEGSFCNVYRNGVLVGPLAAPLRDFRPPHSEFEYWLRLPSVDDNSLGYYPMISVYRGGAARLNCGPDFKYPAPEGCRRLYERYDEQVADDFTADLLNEIVFEKIDQRTPKRLRRSHLKEFKEKKINAQKFF